MRPTDKQAQLYAQLNRLVQAQDWQAALKLAQSAVRKAPTDLGCLEVSAMAASHLGQHALAAQCLGRMVRINPKDLELQVRWASALVDANQAEAAVAALAPVRGVLSQDPLACFVIGRIEYALGEFNRALDAYAAALRLNAQFPEAWVNYAAALQAASRYPEAEQALRTALAQRPQYPRALSNLSGVLRLMDRPDEALALADAALALSPQDGEALINRGAALRELKRDAEAEACFLPLLAVPGAIGQRASMNYQGMLLRAGRVEEYTELLRELLRKRPNDPLARYQRAMLLLQAGDYHEGWREHDARLHPDCLAQGKRPPVAPPNTPRWQGQPLQGASIVVVPEQGYGDELQFVRFVARLKALGAGRLGLSCRSPLARLFQRLPDIDELIVGNDLWQASGWDYWVSMMSLPLHLNVDLQALGGEQAYVSVAEQDAAAWAAQLPSAKARVGLVWRGNPDHHNDRHRSLPSVTSLAPLAVVADIQWLCLQKDVRPDELVLAESVGLPLVNPMPEMQDFYATAALISNLDLVITVDTAVAHLTGALGKPCWVLLPEFATDWRWLMQRTDSPWYPGTMRLFRQDADMRWEPVIPRVAEALAQHVASAEVSA